MSAVVVRNNVHTAGAGPRAMMFAHGFGCDQNMWRHLWPAFEDRFRIIRFDHVGAGGSDLKAYNSEKYSTLEGYAEDVVEIGIELGLQGRHLRRPFGQCDDRATGIAQRAGYVPELSW